MNEIVCSLSLLLILLADIHDLKDVVVGMQLHGTNVDLDVVGKEDLRQRLNFLWPGGAPHQSLSVWLYRQNINQHILKLTLRYSTSYLYSKGSIYTS